MDEPTSPAAPSRAPVIALALAGGALVLAAVTVVVVLTRGGGGGGEAAPAPTPVRITNNGRVLVESTTTAEAAVTAAYEGLREQAGQITVEPPAALGLEPGDVLVSVGGRGVTSTGIARVQLRSLLRMSPEAILLEVLRDGKPLVVRVTIEGDLRAAMAAQRAAGLGSGSGTVPGSGTGSGSLDLSGIVRVDDTHVEVPRALVDAILANPMHVAKGARVMPTVKHGEPNGFKLYAVRPDSLYAKLGFTSGDNVTTVNGHALTTLDSALEVYSKVRTASRLAITMERRGKPIELIITVK